MMSNNERQEMIDSLRDAQSQMYEALESMRHVIDEMERNGENGRYWRNYVLAPIEIATSEDHIWVSRDANIDQWIASL